MSRNGNRPGEGAGISVGINNATEPKSSSAPTQAARTTYARAQQYDSDFERALVDVIGKAIFDASLITDCNVLAIRTGETIHALVAVLGGMLAVSPALCSPTATRKAVDEIAKRLRRQVAAARNDPEIASFTRSVFNGTQTEGSA